MKYVNIFATSYQQLKGVFSSSECNRYRKYWFNIKSVNLLHI